MSNNIFILIVISVVGIVTMVVGVILLQIKDKNTLLLKEQQIAATEIAHQKDLLHAIIASQEAERKRIGIDLHDEVGSMLSSLRMLIERHNGLATSQTGVNNNEETVFNSQSKAIIDQVIKSVREISHNLFPRITGEYGLHDALHELCDNLGSTEVIRIKLDFNEEDCPTFLDVNAAVAVYRVLAELINNTMKHANAKEINISIRASNGQMTVEYRDDGVGFSPIDVKRKKGMGLRNIESRLAMLQATSQTDAGQEKGLSLVINIPVEA